MIYNLLPWLGISTFELLSVYFLVVWHILTSFQGTQYLPCIVNLFWMIWISYEISLNHFNSGFSRFSSPSLFAFLVCKLTDHPILQDKFSYSADFLVWHLCITAIMLDLALYSNPLLFFGINMKHCQSKVKYHNMFLSSLIV